MMISDQWDGLQMFLPLIHSFLPPIHSIYLTIVILNFNRKKFWERNEFHIALHIVHKYLGAYLYYQLSTYTF